MRASRSVRCITLIALVLTGVGVLTAGAHGATLSWSAPRVVDTIPVNPPAAVSCPSASFCAGMAQNGTIFTSTAPQSGSSWTIGDQLVSVVAGESAHQKDPVGQLSCASPQLCAEVDSGRMRVTTNPAGGDWSEVPLQHVVRADCISDQLCVALLEAGPGTQVATSTDPGDGAASVWRQGTASALSAVYAILTPVVCPSAGLCAFGTTGGQIAWSTNPAGGAGTWQLTTVGSENEQFSSLTCPTAQLCIAVSGEPGSAYKTYISTDPGAGRWTALPAASPALQQVSCASATYCLAIAGSNAIEQLGDGDADWTRIASPLPADTPPQTVSCSSGVCTVTGNKFGGQGDAFDVAALPAAGGPLTWASVTLPSQAVSIGRLSCPAQNHCIATDAVGQALTSGDPTGSWHASLVTRAALTGLSCPAVSFCEVSDQSGRVHSSTAPTSGRWQTTYVKGPLTKSLTCASVRLCWVAGPTMRIGFVEAWAVSTNPAAGSWHQTNDWNTGRTANGMDVVSGTAIACASTALCIGTGPASRGDGEDVLEAGTGVYRPHHRPVLIHGISGTAATCPGVHLCVILAGTKLYASAEPATARDWHGATLVRGKTTLTAISCPTTGFCVVGDSAGQVAVASQPTGGTRAWSFRTVDTGHPITALACASAHQCVAGDNAGRFVVATP